MASFVRGNPHDARKRNGMKGEVTREDVAAEKSKVWPTWKCMRRRMRRIS
jgi:hypothetical protein